MAVRDIREAFAGLRDMGLVNDAEVLRQCQRAYQRNGETRDRLAKRLALNVALREMAPGGLLRVTDDLGRTHQVEPSGAALAALTRRLKRVRPDVVLSVSLEQAPTLFLPFDGVA